MLNENRFLGTFRGQSKRPILPFCWTRTIGEAQGELHGAATPISMSHCTYRFGHNLVVNNGEGVMQQGESLQQE